MGKSNPYNCFLLHNIYSVVIAIRDLKRPMNIAYLGTRTRITPSDKYVAISFFWHTFLVDMSNLHNIIRYFLAKLICIHVAHRQSSSEQLICMIDVIKYLWDLKVRIYTNAKTWCTFIGHNMPIRSLIMTMIKIRAKWIYHGNYNCFGINNLFSKVIIILWFQFLR